MPPEASTSPQGTAVLLIGIPIDPAEVRSRKPGSDYLRRFPSSRPPAGEPPGTPPPATDPIWLERVAQPLQELARQGTALGVEVVRRARLEDLARATERASVVVLVSHWKGFELAPGDLPRPLDEAAFAERIAAADDELSHWLEERLASRPPTWRRWLTRRSTAPTLPEVLGQALERPICRTPTEGVDEVLEHPDFVRALRRDQLDRLFRGLLRPGNRLELFDGLVTKEEVAEAVWPRFEGVLDLTACASAYAAEHVARRHGFRFRTVNFPRPQQPEWAALVLGASLELFHQGLGYLEAREAARKQLRSLVTQIAGRDSGPNPRRHR